MKIFLGILLSFFLVSCASLKRGCIDSKKQAKFENSQFKASTNLTDTLGYTIQQFKILKVTPVDSSYIVSVKRLRRNFLSTQKRKQQILVLCSYLPDSFVKGKVIEMPVRKPVCNWSLTN